MSANVVTSNTGIAAGTDPNFTVAYKTNASTGLVFYLKYTKGTETGITITFSSLNTSLGTDLYNYVTMSGTALSPYAMTITASGNYRIPTPVIVSENKIVATIVFASSAQGGAVVGNFMEA